MSVLYNVGNKKIFTSKKNNIKIPILQGKVNCLQRDLKKNSHKRISRYLFLSNQNILERLLAVYLL